MRLGTSWTKPWKLCHVGDDSLYYSFTALPKAMYVRGMQKQISTMCPLRAYGVARGFPLAAFFFGDTRFFFGTKKEMGVFPRAVSAVSHRPCKGQKSVAVAAR